jgi:DNA-binding transcriptional MocR family regulator
MNATNGQVAVSCRPIPANTGLAPLDDVTWIRTVPSSGRTADSPPVAQYMSAAVLATFQHGAQHGLAATIMATLQAGDVVAADALTYPGFKVLARTLQLELAPLPATSGGPDLDALKRLCRQRRIRALYAMPALHNPLGWVANTATRARLVKIARRHEFLIIEDPSYAYLAEMPPPPLAALAPEITVYVSGLSKNVATGLRVGFVSAPAALVPAIERAIRATTWNTPAITTAIACRWLEDGTVSRLKARKRDDARSRQALARDALAGLTQIGHPSSYFLWLPLPGDARADRVAASLAREHISVSTAVPFATSTPVPQAIPLALGSADLGSLRKTLCEVRQIIEADTLR